MAENGVNGHSRCKEMSELTCKVGLLNCKDKYLTAESFGKLNITGKALKPKQLWTLEHDRSDEKVIYLKSPLQEAMYVTTDKYGNVCLVDEKRDDTKFMVEYGTGEYSGRWLFRNVCHGTLLGTGAADAVTCFKGCKSGGKHDAAPDAMECWTPQLYIHPQVNIRNVNRKRYAHLCDDQLQCSEIIPWGHDALIMLEFVKGKYALRTSDNRYLKCDGSLSDDLSEESKYTLEIRSGKDAGLAFKDSEQRYLTCVGSTATMKSRNKTISKDELFIIEDSHPQVVFLSEAGKKVSVKQGMDISANQTGEETDTETFQIEYIAEPNKWAIRTCKGAYWSVANTPGSGSAVQANSKELKDTSLFDLQWQGDGSVGMLAENGKYVSHKSTGALVATAETLEEKEKFKVKIINRPILVLRCPYGFVGLRSNAYICNKADYDVITLEPNNEGTYAMKDTVSGKYWSLADDCRINPDADEATWFTIEFHKQSFITIKAPNGRYLKGEQNGNFRAVGEEVGSDTLWEF